MNEQTECTVDPNRVEALINDPSFTAIIELSRVLATMNRFKMDTPSQIENDLRHAIPPSLNALEHMLSKQGFSVDEMAAALQRVNATCDTQTDDAQ